MKKIIKRIPLFLVMVSFAACALVATFVPNYEWAANLVNLGTLLNLIVNLSFGIIILALIFGDMTMKGYESGGKVKDNIEKVAAGDKMSTWLLWPLLIQLVAFTIAGYGFAIFVVVLAMILDVFSTVAYNAEREKAIATMVEVNKAKEEQDWQKKFSKMMKAEVFTQEEASRLRL